MKRMKGKTEEILKVGDRNEMKERYTLRIKIHSSNSGP